MKTLHRYILGEVFVYFLICLFLLTFLLLLNRLIQLTELVVNKGVPITVVGRLLLTTLPVLLLATLPMAILIACILVFSRLSNDSELVAMTASGMSLYSQLIPSGTVGLLAALLSAGLLLFGLPWSHQATQEISRELLRSRAAAFEVQEQVFNGAFDGLVIYVRKMDQQSGIMRGVLISDSRDAKNEQVIFADQGMLVNDPNGDRLILRLVHGTLHKIIREEPAKPEKGAATAKDQYQIVRFGTYDLNLDLTQTIGDTRALRTSLRSLPLSDLRQAMEQEPPGTVRYNAMLIEFHKKFATPFVCLLLALLGSPLGVQNRRSGRHGGFAVSLAVLFIYYAMGTFSDGMGENGTIPPVLAAWGPNLLLLALTGWAVRRVVRRGALDIFGLLTSPLRRLPVPEWILPKTA